MILMNFSLMLLKILEISIKINKEHPSVMEISENNTINNELNFKHVSEEFVTKQINQINKLHL